MKRRILHVSATTMGGVGLNLLLLARYMDRKTFDLSFALPPDSAFYHDIVETGVKVYSLSISRQPWQGCNIKGFRQLRGLMEEEKFDIVHTHTSVGGFLGRIAARSRAVPCVLWSIHGWAHDYPRGTWLSKQLFLALEKFLDRFTDHYVAVCQQMKDVGVAHRIFQGEKATVIYYGIDAAKYRADGAKDIRRELALPDNAIVVGTAGRFEPQKGLDLFLRAAQEVKSMFPGVKFLTLGDGPLRADLEAQALALGLRGEMIFPGWKTNVLDYIKVMDLFCLPSRWEALPLVLLEVMAVGKPIVATNVGGVAEALEDGEGGILVAPESPKELISAISRLLGNAGLRKVMGGYNRARVDPIFTVERMVERYEELYKNLVH